MVSTPLVLKGRDAMPIDIERLSDSAVTAAAVRRLMPLGGVRPVPRDAVLARAGDAVDRLFLVLSGRFLCSVPLAETGSDLPVPVEELMRGTLIGLADWCADRRHSVTVEAVAAGEVVEIDPARLAALAAADGELALVLVGLLSIGLRHCIGATEAMRQRTVKQRTAAYLLGLPPASRGGGLEVRLPMAKKILAAHLGMTQQSLSRVLRHLRADGVTVRGRHIAIADPSRLQAMLEGHA